MIFFDENITADQLLKLEIWKIKGKRIGIDIARKGTKDEQLITELQQLKGVLFVSHDGGFFKKSFCHSNSGIVFLDVDGEELAYYIRKFLKHTLFDTMKKRLGKVVKVNQTIISFYQLK